MWSRPPSKKWRRSKNIQLSHAERFACCEHTIRYITYSTVGRSIASISDLVYICTLMAPFSLCWRMLYILHIQFTLFYHCFVSPPEVSGSAELVHATSVAFSSTDSTFALQFLHECLRRCSSSVMRTCSTLGPCLGQSYCKLVDKNSVNECLESDSAKQIWQSSRLLSVKVI